MSEDSDNNGAPCHTQNLPSVPHSTPAPIHNRAQIKARLRLILICPTCDIPLLKRNDVMMAYCPTCGYEKTLVDAGKEMKKVLMDVLFNTMMGLQGIWAELVQELE